MAEAIFMAKAAGSGIEIDSAGTGEWHIGHPADPRTRAECERRGTPATTKARQLRAEDFDAFDLILVMDRANQRDVNGWKNAKPEKVRLMLDFHPDPPTPEVPDPYYGGPEGFVQIYDLLEPACEGLLQQLR